MQHSKELYYYSQGIPTPKPFTVLEPYNRSPSQSSPVGNSKHFSIAAEVGRLRAGEMRSEHTINEVAEKNRLIDFLRTELNLLRENYRRQAEEQELLHMQDSSSRHRIRVLEQELETEKGRASKLEFQSKLQSLQRDTSSTQLIIADYEQKLGKMQADMQIEVTNRDRQIQSLRDQLKRIQESAVFTSAGTKTTPQTPSNLQVSNLENERKALLQKIKQMGDQHQRRMFELHNLNGDLGKKYAKVSHELETLTIQARNESFKRDMEQQECEMEVVRLKEQLDKCQQRNKQLKGESQFSKGTAGKVSEQTRAKLEKEISEKYMARLNQMRTQLIDRISEIERRYGELEEAYDNERQSKQMLMNRVEQLSSSMEMSAREEQRAISSERRIFDEKELVYQQQIHLLKLKSEEQRQCFERKVHEFDDICGKMTYLQRRIIELEQERAVLHEQFRLREGVLKQQNSPTDPAQLNKKLQEMVNRLDSQTSKCFELEQNYNAELQRVRGQFATVQKTWREEKEVFMASERCLLETNKSLQSNFVQLTSQLEGTTEALRMTRHQNNEISEASRATIENIRQQLKSQYQEHSTKLQEELRERQIGLVESLCSKQATLNQLRIELNDKDELLNRVVTRLTECQTQLELLEHEQECLKSERNELREELAAVEREFNDVKSQLINQSVNQSPNNGEAPQNGTPDSWNQKHRHHQESPQNEKAVMLEMENNWIKAEQHMLKEDFARVESMLLKANEELAWAKQEVALGQCRRLEQAAQLEQSNKTLTERITQLELSQQRLRVEHQQMLDAEERAHGQQLDSEVRRVEQARRVLAAELEKVKESYRRSEAAHLAENLIMRQSSNDQIKKYAEVNGALELELSRLRRETTMMNAYLQAEHRNYNKLKAKYDFIKQGFLAVQEGLEDDDCPAVSLEQLITGSVEPPQTQSIMGSQYCLTDELLITNTYAQATIMSQLSESNNGQLEHRQPKVQDASIFEINVVEIQCSKTSEASSEMQLAEYLEASHSEEATPNKQTKQSTTRQKFDTPP